MNHTPLSYEAILSRNAFLFGHGFLPLDQSGSRYSKAGKVYDLSAADLEQIKRIEREGLFLCKD